MNPRRTLFTAAMNPSSTPAGGTTQRSQGTRGVAFNDSTRFVIAPRSVNPSSTPASGTQVTREIASNGTTRFGINPNTQRTTHVAAQQPSPLIIRMMDRQAQMFENALQSWSGVIVPTLEALTTAVQSLASHHARAVPCSDVSVGTEVTSCDVSVSAAPLVSDAAVGTEGLSHGKDLAQAATVAEEDIPDNNHEKELQAVSRLSLTPVPKEPFKKRSPSVPTKEGKRAKK